MPGEEESGGLRPTLGQAWEGALEYRETSHLSVLGAFTELDAS